MAADREALSDRRTADCGCGPVYQRPKPNGTCATCGGWLPGERPAPLPWLSEALNGGTDA